VLKTLALTAVSSVALVLAVFGAQAALADSHTFSASYSGQVTEKVDGQNVTATATGKGSGTLVKASTIAGVVQATTANPPCSPFNGPGAIKSSLGTLKLAVLPTSRGCAAGEDDQNNISLSGSAKVTSGTGKFKKAHGTLRFSGHYDRAGGAFTVKLTGVLTY
jgi:hypothetical protein